MGQDVFSHGGASGASGVSGVSSGVTGDGNYTVSISFPATTSVVAAVVSDLALTFNVPAPAAGAAPVTSFAGPQYAGYVRWSPSPGVFMAGTVYQATVRLSAASGYTFNGVGANAFSHIYAPGGVSGAVESDGTYTVTIVFPVTGGAAVIPVTDRVLTYNVASPVTGATPVSSFAGAQYAGTVVWWEEALPDPVRHSGAFQAGTVYRAEVTLYAMTGWTFTGVEENAFAHGRGAVTHPEGSGSVLEASVSFAATAAMPAVTDLALTYNVPAPEAGATPVTSFAGPQYAGFIAWKETAGGAPYTGLFVNGTAYTADVTLSALPGWTFTGVEANAFAHGRGAVTHPAGSGTVMQVSVSFVPTGVTPPVNDLALTYNIPAPVTGATPVTSFSAAQYAGFVDWYNVTNGGTAHAGPFLDAKVYRAEVTLHALSGYAFSGVEADAFTHRQAVTVTNPEGTGGTLTVSIVFPQASPNVPPVLDAVVTDLALSYNVPAPVNGATPVRSFAGAQYTGVAAWEDVTGGGSPSGLFGNGKVYRATVTLYAAPGWTFNGLGADAFTHEAASAVTHAAGSGASLTVTVTFQATGALPRVTDLSLTGKIQAPVQYGTPVKSFAGAQYTGVAVWENVEDGTSLGGLFETGKVYRAAVTLYAASGWTFSGAEADAFTHAQAATVTNPEGTGGTLTVTVTFNAATGTVLPQAVTDLALTSNVPAPVNGATPVTSFAGNQYTGVVAWADVPDNAALSGLFGNGKVYKATVTLYALSGYTFSGVAANAFTHGAPGAAVTNTTGSGSLTVTVTFAATGALPKVTDTALTYKIPAPVAQATPVTSFDGTP